MNTYSITDRFKRLWKDEGGWIQLAALAVPALSKLFSGGAKNSSEGRTARDNAQLERDRLAQRSVSDYEQALQNRRQLEMEQRQMDAAAREAGFKGALRASAIQQWQPAGRPNNVPTISFVKRPETAALPEYERQMMLRLLEGEKFDALPAVERFKPSPVSEASTWEKISGGLGLGFGALDALLKLRKDQADEEDQNWTL